jgi:hypothetical protein
MGRELWRVCVYILHIHSTAAPPVQFFFFFFLFSVFPHPPVQMLVGRRRIPQFIPLSVGVGAAEPESNLLALLLALSCWGLVDPNA